MEQTLNTFKQCVMQLNMIMDITATVDHYAQKCHQTLFVGASGVMTANKKIVHPLPSFLMKLVSVQFLLSAANYVVCHVTVCVCA